MSTNVDNPAQKTRRPVVFLLFGLLLFGAAGYLIHDLAYKRSPLVPTPQTYRYTTEQSMQNDVRYRQSSFFTDSPGPTNTAYIANLTDSIQTQLRYKLQANQKTDLSYAYDVKAVLQSTYTNHNEEDSTAKNVWTKQFDLVKPTTGKQHTDRLQLNPKAVIPYTEYRQLAQQFNDAIETPISSQAVVTLTVRVQGTSNGTPFEDRKVSTITLPLDQQVYTLATKFIRSESHQIKPTQGVRFIDILNRYQPVFILCVLTLGVACSIYGVRRQTITSPHHRELDRIYRLHDGIIIKASRPANLNNKNVVTVQSFDDLLNIEDEIKTPIIASKVSDTTTHFLITRDDIVYVYTLGDPVPFKPPVTAAPTQAPAKPTKPPVAPPSKPAPTPPGVPPVPKKGLIDTRKPGSPINI